MPSKDADQFLEKLAKVMREERLAKGLSQEAWAVASGVDRATISRWERLERVPSIMALYDLAAALDAPLHVLCQKAG